MNKKPVVDILNHPSGGKIIRVTHEDGEIAAFIKRPGSNRLTRMVDPRKEKQ